jgi:hypothetical protein
VFTAEPWVEPAKETPDDDGEDDEANPRVELSGVSTRSRLLDRRIVCLSVLMWSCCRASKVLP